MNGECILPIGLSLSMLLAPSSSPCVGGSPVTPERWATHPRPDGTIVHRFIVDPEPSSQTDFIFDNLGFYIHYWNSYKSPAYFVYVDEGAAVDDGQYAVGDGWVDPVTSEAGLRQSGRTFTFLGYGRSGYDDELIPRDEDIAFCSEVDPQTSEVLWYFRTGDTELPEAPALQSRLKRE